MPHLLLKAAVQTATDEGVFTAIISSASIDRERDVVSPSGMLRALQRWASAGKAVPLAWDHSREPDKQIGYVDPSSARVVGDEVLVQGWIDQSIDAGRHAWRLVKAGTLGFSFGYLTHHATPRPDGGKNLLAFDVFEVTATTLPANPSTRVVAWKGLDTEEDDMNFRRRSGLQRLLGEDELTPTIAAAVLQVGRQELGRRAEWEDIDPWLKRSTKFELQRLRKSVLVELERRKAVLVEQRQQQASDAGWQTKPVDHRPVQVVVKPGGALSLDVWDQDLAVEAQAEQRRATVRSEARLQQVADRAESFASAQQAGDAEDERLTRRRLGLE